MQFIQLVRLQLACGNLELAARLVPSDRHHYLQRHIGIFREGAQAGSLDVLMDDEQDTDRRYMHRGHCRSNTRTT